MMNDFKKTIFVIGLPGSGKSDLSKLLAEYINYTFFDMDKVIESREKKTINKIFEDRGEKYFREVDAVSITGSIYKMLKEKGAIFCQADTEMTALLPTEEQKTLLKIDDEALLKATTWLYDQDDDLIEYTEMFYVGSKYNYYIHINKNGEVYEL